MARTKKKTYSLRNHDEKVSYRELSDPEGDSLSSDSDNSRSSPSRPSTRRKTTLCSSRELETEMVKSVDLFARGGRGHGQGVKTRLSSQNAIETEIADSSVDFDAGRLQGRGRGGRGRGRGGGRGGGGGQGTRSCLSQKTATNVEQKKESSHPGPSSIMEKGPSSPATSMKRDSPQPKRSCRKTILSWLIDCQLIDEDEEVCYMGCTKESALMTGRITRGRILCSCCQRETSVWTFEKHAGSNLGQPYQHIYLLSKGTSLQDCQIAAWEDANERKRRCIYSYVPKETVADHDDDACSICGNGGDLICCDKCPSVYHPLCMNMERVPRRDWLCPYCICKYCGLGGEIKEFITCSQCDKKFHWGCFKEFEKEFSKATLDLNCSRLYCGPGCREIYEKMEGSLGIKNDVFASYSWRVIRHMDMNPKVASASRNLHLENNSKVAVTWMLMKEAVKTITDRHTGINVVQSVVYSCGSNLTRINFSRFYTFVLEKDDEIIAAASIRFHGRRIAEMPFIAIEEAYRGQGICQELMRVIESFLCNLKVEYLIIPSAPETSGMWKCKFNFKEVSKELMKEISSNNILMVADALRLYKDLSSTRIADNQTDSQNRPDPQTEHVDRTPEQQMERTERPLLDLNVSPDREDK
ncbi:increased DNA methylation 1-like [Gastrolobium bilobum]|uniref:increased DNA methylation 1-like n=1 Tax=Gastrolobium bilobum TaxID=150636 RepID=UPI002AAF91CF|nr:increased DNA methylation 1-like [Gastrolobium bilobum]XP_061337046.1 increased DNA methylation 1-like [Gastrolobium bilobum]